MPQVLVKKIIHHCDSDAAWHKLIPPLIKNRYRIDPCDLLSIHGDAPKDFVRLRERPANADGRIWPDRVSSRSSRWPAYIAKVGSKWYPIESVTEQLITRVGQIAGLRIASSQLRMIGGQVRFLSRYFLQNYETLYHGFDMFSELLGQDFVVQVSEAKQEPDVYTFQSIGEAILDRFPDQFYQIMCDLTEMIAFDALVGNNDRHPANWGVVVSITGEQPPRFSPVFDTARALFWNIKEEVVRSCLHDSQRFNKYLRKTTPQIGWHHKGAVTHFDLVRGIYDENPEYRHCLAKFASTEIPQKARDVLHNEFRLLMSDARREAVLRCLESRMNLFRASVS